jgi:hypothetical protein
MKNAAFTPGTDLAAASRNFHRMEVWVLGRDDDILRGKMMEVWAVGRDGIVRGNWFDGRWHDWYELAWSSGG